MAWVQAGELVGHSQSFEAKTIDWIPQLKLSNKLDDIVGDFIGLDASE